MYDKRKNDYLPQVRCSPALREALEKIAAQSITPSIADHVRYAVKRYIDQVAKEQQEDIELLDSPSPQQAVPGQQPA